MNKQLTLLKSKKKKLNKKTLTVLYASDVMVAKSTEKDYPAEGAMALVCLTANSMVTS
jgi:hypothetical protein